MTTSTLSIVGTSTDGVVSQSWSTTATAIVDTITVTATVSPLSAPQGTTRTLTVTAVSSAGNPVTIPTPTTDTVVETVFTPTGVPGQWTFVF